MSKKAVIDVGSLKVKVAVFDTKRKKLLSSQSAMTLLGKGISEQHHIPDESLQLLDDALRQTATELTKEKVKDMVIIGTEALRSADNTPAVQTMVQKYFPSHQLEIIDQHKEADLFFTAVSREFPGQDIVAMDIGGGSVQLIYGRYNYVQQQPMIRKKYNLQTGAYRLQQRFSPGSDHVSPDFPKAKEFVARAFQAVSGRARILVFGSTCMCDFILASGVPVDSDTTSQLHPVRVSKNVLEALQAELSTLAPNKRDHYFPAGGYFMYGADYLLLNLLAAIDRTQPERIYPTNLNSSYAFI